MGVKLSVIARGISVGDEVVICVRTLLKNITIRKIHENQSWNAQIGMAMKYYFCSSTFISIQMCTVFSIYSLNCTFY